MIKTEFRCSKKPIGVGNISEEEEEEEEGWDLGYRSLSSLSKAGFYYWWWLNNGSNKLARVMDSPPSKILVVASTHTVKTPKKL